MEQITGIVDVYLFYSDDNGYSVFKLEDGTAVVGNLPKLNAGDEVEITGSWVTHQKYGIQFKVESLEVNYPTTESGITRYLASGLIKGIGKVTAERIVRKFGEIALNILDENINRLLEIEGIGRKKLETIKIGWEEQKGIKNVMLFLQTHGISTAYSLKIYKTYGDQAPEVIKRNPYRLMSDVWGIGFKVADNIARNLGFTESDGVRIKAGIIYILSEAVRNGHVFVPEGDLVRECSYVLQYELAYSDPLLHDLESDGEIVIDSSNVYLHDYYYAEREIENSINRILNFKSDDENSKLAFNLLKEKYSEEQLKAIQLSFENNFLIVTGGPGTGKTTTLKGIIELYKFYEKSILLAAPTGRAAKRMTEVIGLEAKTIHRLLEYNPVENSFNFNSDTLLETDLIIIDEVSMMDTILMYHLITAISENTTVILVGDVDQLPSIGAGNVLKDLIASNKIPLVELSAIFRQAKHSDIILNAHRINKGNMPALNYLKDSDFIFIDESENKKIPEKILRLCKEDLPINFGLDPVNDIQILSPIYKTDVGVANLNKAMQQNLNHSETLYLQGDRKFKAKDKVMQLRNNYDKNVFNGDIGFVAGVDDIRKIMYISFEGRIVEYLYEDLDEITLAYAVTVHKSQGSEFPCVIIPVSTSHYMMLQRNLLYTAITRATKLLVIIGTKRAMGMAVNNNKVKNRFTSLFKL